MSYASYSKLGQLAAPQNQTQYPELELVKSEQHRNQIIQSFKVLVVDNYTDWCGPCKLIDPQIRELAHQFNGVIKFVKENADDELDGAPAVTGVPCFHFYVDGKHYPNFTITGGDVEGVKNSCTQILQQISNHQQN